MRHLEQASDDDRGRDLLSLGDSVECIPDGVW